MEAGKKWWKLRRSGRSWDKVVEAGKKWWKLGKSGGSWEEVVKAGKKWCRLGRSGGGLEVHEEREGPGPDGILNEMVMYDGRRLVEVMRHVMTLDEE